MVSLSASRHATETGAGRIRRCEIIIIIIMIAAAAAWIISE
jgi:hypothetical protein